MKIALVYDRINKFGGAERVLMALHELFPQAPVFTSVYDPSGAPWARILNIRTSFLQKIPFARNSHEKLVMFMPYAFESFDFSAYDLVISLTSAEAKGIIVKPPTKHLCYLLTPTRYLWNQTQSYAGLGLAKCVKIPFMSSLRRWDYLASQRPDHYLAISQTVANRCRKYYRREVNDVVYPPVDTDQFLNHPDGCFTKDRGYYLAVSRLVPYKNIDQVIKAFIKLPTERLLIIGAGSELPRLKSLSRTQANITYLGHLTDTELSCVYHHARALIFPQEEDFGLTAVEAQAAGIPVIALNRGGATETVVPGETGILYDRNTPEALIKAVRESQSLIWSVNALVNNARRFSKTIFMSQFKQSAEAIYGKLN
jgi:glycosyltransferase involved in cell wall biosynthesis